MLHTLYQQSTEARTPSSHIEFFAIDLIMVEWWSLPRRRLRLILRLVYLHRFSARTVILATGGYGRAYFSCTSAHT